MERNNKRNLKNRYVVENPNYTQKSLLVKDFNEKYKNADLKSIYYAHLDSD